MRLVSQIKSYFVKPGVRPRRILLGVARNVRFGIDLTCKSQRLLGLEEREIAAPFARFCREARTFVDVGANDGYYTTLAAVLNSRAKIFACDPAPRMRERCQLNLRLNGLDLGERIDYRADCVGTSVDTGFVSLDRLLDGAPSPVCIKVDVDGPELDVLQSGEKALRTLLCRLIVETHSRELERDCIAYLEALAYRCRVVKNAWWRILVPELRRLEHNRWFLAEPANPDGPS